MTLQHNFADPDSEFAVLGAVMQDPRLWTDVRGVLVADDFFMMRNRWVYEAYDRLVKANKPIDPLTVKAELRNMGKLTDFGEENIFALIGAAVSSDHLPAYLDAVALAAYRDRLMRVAAKLSEVAKTASTNRGELESLASAAFDDARKVSSDDQIATMSQVINELWDEIEATRGMSDGVSGFPTGIDDYDDLIDGLQPDSLNIWAGRPGMGKSAGLTTVALQASMRGARVYLSSLEMDKKEVGRRISAAKSRIDSSKLRRGLRPSGMSPQEWNRFMDDAGVIGKMPIYLDTKKYITVHELHSRIERMARRLGGLDLVIIDYLQLINADPVRRKRGNDNRNYEVDEIARVMKAEIAPIAPVLVAAQLNREPEKRQDKRPVLSDLRDSGALEQHADTVTFLYRNSVYNPETEFPNRIEMIVAKNRHGRIGTVYQVFEKEYTRISKGTTFNVNNL